MNFLLVVENDKMRNYLKKIITLHQDECWVLTEEKSILSSVKLHNPDWVLVDVLWKYENAFKLTEELKSGYPSVNIAVLSDTDDARFRHKATKAGASVMIPKENLYDFYKIISTKYLNIK